ncbi:hypothetical protein KUV80_06755 [Fictibacillus nanhaiensis]|uniref:hypothetical protein n=1 Tax=Fictibacillus nanhaiensis TaxID=742169 RepID=UPI001C982EA0|nr:hypothetical protein [Fictibacillus nanhaiensis]MBY6036344.1 hypothetical protein [Fictibacillus nanhaiensis]
MLELVGICERCKKKLYCLDGFFQGEVAENGNLYCMSCMNSVNEMKKEIDTE